MLVARNLLDGLHGRILFFVGDEGVTVWVGVALVMRRVKKK